MYGEILQPLSLKLELWTVGPARPQPNGPAGAPPPPAPALPHCPRSEATAPSLRLRRPPVRRPRASSPQGSCSRSPSSGPRQRCASLFLPSLQRLFKSVCLLLSCRAVSCPTWWDGAFRSLRVSEAPRWGPGREKGAFWKTSSTSWHPVLWLGDLLPSLLFSSGLFKRPAFSFFFHFR